MLERRRPRPDPSRADVEQLLTREDINLRERVTWQLLYESAARSAEVLALDVEDLDLPNRRARIEPTTVSTLEDERLARLNGGQVPGAEQ